MTADDFCHWLDAMKAAGLARSNAACARQLGISQNAILILKVKGGNIRTALACSALLHRLKPYQAEAIRLAAVA